MKVYEILAEDGKIVPGVNTTVDVQPGETERQAKKFFGGNGKPRPLGVNGATPNQAFNLGLSEDVSGPIRTLQKGVAAMFSGKNYSIAVDMMHKAITKKLAQGPLRHPLEYYARMIEKQFAKDHINPNKLLKMYVDTYGMPQ